MSAAYRSSALCRNSFSNIGRSSVVSSGNSRWRGLRASTFGSDVDVIPSAAAGGRRGPASRGGALFSRRFSHQCSARYYSTPVETTRSDDKEHEVVEVLDVPPVAVEKNLDDVYRYAQMEQNGISLLGLQEFGDQPANMQQQTLMAAAIFLHRELPIRLAHRIVELIELPYGLSETKGVSTVREWYKESFFELLDCPQPTVPDKMTNFKDMLERIYQRHSPTLVNMAAGVVELQRELGYADGGGLPPYLEESITPFLDAFFTSRIGIRTLIEQHLALHDHADGWVGIIHKECSPELIAMEAIDQARFMCERSLGIAPDASVVGPEGFTFPYIPSHVHHMLFELIKNSMRAVVEFHGAEDEDALPPVRVIISAGDHLEDVVIKVADEGGGIPRSAMSRIWSYSYTTAAPVQLGGPVAGDDFTVDTPLAGLGYGLGLSRLYARYYGGDLQILSMEGYGTDAYLHLALRGDHAEPLQAANISRPAAFHEAFQDSQTHAPA